MRECKHKATLVLSFERLTKSQSKLKQSVKIIDCIYCITCTLCIQRSVSSLECVCVKYSMLSLATGIIVGKLPTKQKKNTANKR